MILRAVVRGVLLCAIFLVSFADAAYAGLDSNRSQLWHHDRDWW